MTAQLRADAHRLFLMNNNSIDCVSMKCIFISIDYNCIDSYLLLIISELVNTDDIFNLSNCNILLNDIIRNPIYIKRMVYSVHQNMNDHIKNKALNCAIRNQRGEICEYFISKM